MIKYIKKRTRKIAFIALGNPKKSNLSPASFFSKYLLKIALEVQRCLFAMERVFTQLSTSEGSFQKHLFVGTRHCSPLQ